MTVDIIPTGHIDQFWPSIEAEVIQCIKDTRADCSAGDLWALCRSGSAFLMVVHDEGRIGASLVWQAQTWPHGVVLNNLITVSNGAPMKEWREPIEAMARRLARSCGASTFIWRGSPAWGRIFKDAKVLSIIYEMEV